MKTWQRREQIRDSRDIVIAIGESARFGIDGVELAREVSARLANGWVLAGEPSETAFYMKSPVGYAGKPQWANTVTWASYFIEGFD